VEGHKKEMEGQEGEEVEVQVQEKHNGEVGVEVACCIEHASLKMHSAPSAPALPLVPRFLPLMRSCLHPVPKPFVSAD